ncbi:DNA/RNA non-specific endonuclease [Paenibacillus borealis]|uniref:DNA/RNA non-specific endonuclease n=1 Tax=Paenibacillus borealis TaxID=160799 RepID=UPI000AAD3F2B|nr:DNA/RNA non-specific endonuclease [Paenibacillus borealis]
MSSARLIFNEDEVQRLQTRIGQVSQDTNRLYLQLKGQSSGWGGIPLGDHLVKAQVMINELTVEAEKLEDIIRTALKGVAGLQEENKRQADKLTQQFSLLTGAFGSFGTPNAAGRVSIPAFVQKSVAYLITSVTVLLGKDELNNDPAVQKLRNIIQTSGLLTVEGIAALSKLKDIFAARDGIAKAQMAFKVYEAFGNKTQMEAVHAQAEEARRKLASLGVGKVQYEAGKDLSGYFKQPAVKACDYDPSITAESVPLIHNEEYLLLLRLAMEKSAAGNYARSQLEVKREEIRIAEAVRQVQEQIEAARRLNGPPLELPDGTPITASNKRNETTFNYYMERISDPKVTNQVLAYEMWLEDTYGMTAWRKKVVQADAVVRAFGEGLITEVVMGVADTATFAFNVVVHPVKTTTEMKNQAVYIMEHPEVLVEAAKMAYHNFDEGTPEEKAAMLGSVASILVPGLQVTKIGKAGKVFSGVEDVVSQAAKDALKGIKQKLPDLGPVLQTPEGLAFKAGEIPDAPALPKTSVQQQYIDAMDEMGGGGSRIEGPGEVPEKTFADNPFDDTGKLIPNAKYKAGEHQYNYETDQLGRIEKFSTDELKLTARDERLPHDANTPGKVTGDHAGHLAGDRFGGSPEIDNLVSQSSNVNLSKYKKIENQWAAAIKEGKQVKVNVEVKYEGDDLRPSKFIIDYEIDGEFFSKDLLN